MNYGKSQSRAPTLLKIKMLFSEDRIREACLLAGFCLLIHGIWLIYQPAALIVGGLILIWLGIPPKPPRGGGR